MKTYRGFFVAYTSEKNSALAKTSSVLRLACLGVWLLAILAGAGSYLAYPQAFTAENIAAFLLRFQGEIWLVYLAMSALRGFSLLPSTPLVIAGSCGLDHRDIAVVEHDLCIFRISRIQYFF